MVVVKSAGSSGGEQIEAAVVGMECIMCGLVDLITSESGNATIARLLIGGSATSPTLHQEIPAVVHTAGRGSTCGIGMAVSGSGSGSGSLLLTLHDEPLLPFRRPHQTMQCVACPAATKPLSLRLTNSPTLTPEHGSSSQTVPMT